MAGPETGGQADSASWQADLRAWEQAVHSGNHETVRALAERFLSTEGDRWLHLAGHVAWHFLRTGEPSRAAAVYEQIVERAPSMVDARYLAFQARLIEGKDDQARAHLRAVIEQQSLLSKDSREPARAYGRLLLDLDAAEGHGRKVRLTRKALGTAARLLLPKSRSGPGEFSLLLWRSHAALAPRDFAAPPQWRIIHEEAADAVRKVRTALARIVATRMGAPQDLWIGSVKTHESLRLYSVARNLRPKVVVQAGVFAGYSACLLAEACRRNERGLVYCVDPNIPHFCVDDPSAWCRELTEALGLGDFLRFHKGVFATPLWRYGDPPGSGLDPMVGPRVFAESGPADLVFVDGDHSTPSALADMALAAANLAEGGVILLHDTSSWRQVRRAVAALLSENRLDRYIPYGRHILKYSELCPLGIDGLGMLTIIGHRDEGKSQKPSADQ